jgi:hypothetical protein
MYRGHVAVTIIIQRWLDSPYRRKRRGAERREEGLVPEAIALRPELLEAWFRDGTKLTCLDRREIHKRLGRFNGEIAPSSQNGRIINGIIENALVVAFAACNLARVI